MNANREQIDSWAGTAGEQWALRQDALDRALQPVSALVIEAARVASGERVLDVGCGCGDTTLALAALTGPGGRVTGVDVSPPMLARARARLGASASPVDFIEADASVAPLPTALDLVFSRFGVMFFADPVAAFTHLHAAQRPGGRLALACWCSAREQAWVDQLVSAVAPHLPPPAANDPLAPGPFAFADRDRVSSMLARAGYADVTHARHEPKVRWSSSPSLDDAVDFFTHIGPTSRRIAEAPEGMRPAARAALRTELARHLDRDGVALGSAVWIVTARA